MAIKIGNLDINSFKVCSDDCKIYLGDTLLYPTTPPSFDGKWKATYQDGHVESAQCGSSSSIIQHEINKTNLVSVEIGDCVTSIGMWVFSYCSNLTSVTIPNSVNSIGMWAFYSCKGLTSIDIPSGVTSIGNTAFGDCTSLTSITIPSGVTSIGYQAFSSCSSLTSITIPNSVISIDGGAFQYCSSLPNIDIPNGVTSIGNSAFYNCSGLTSITVNAVAPPELGMDAFYGSTCPILVPSQSLEAYKNAWSQYASRIQAIPNS